MRRTLRATIPNELVDDTASEVFARAYAGWRQYDPRRGTPEAWLDRIALNLVADLHRHLRVMRRLDARLPWPRAADDDVALDEALARLDVRAAAKTLSSAERAIVELAANEDAPVPVLALHLGCSTHEARKRLYGAVSALRAPTLSPARRG